MANEPVVKEFNKALYSMRDSKTAISKQKIVEITKAAMNALRFYKHVVLNIEKFIQKCNPSFKVPAFYVIDSIVRQGIKQHKHKDVFGPRFSVNLINTLKQVLNCSEEDKLKIVRVINLWRVHNVFASNVIESLLHHCQSSGLDVDIRSVEMKVKGDKADMTIYAQDNEQKKPKKMTPLTPPRDDFNESFASRVSQETNLSDVAPVNGISEKEINTRLRQTFPHWAALIEKDQAGFQKFASLVNDALKERVDREKANQGANISSILTQDFDYSDDEEEVKQKSEFQLSTEKISSLVNDVFADANFRADAATIYTSVVSVASNPSPPKQISFPDVSNIFANKQLPLGNPWFNNLSSVSSTQYRNPFIGSDQNTVPTPVAPPPTKNQQTLENEKFESSSRSSKHSKKRDRGRSPESHSADRKRRHHSRSPNSPEKDRERERRRLGLPTRLRDEQTILASRTLWFGRLPTNCTEQDIRNAVKDSGSSPEQINIISSRACAYVTMPQRRSAYKIIDRLRRDVRVNGKSIKLEWTVGAGIQKSDKIMDYWDSDRGYLSIPHKKLPSDLGPLLEGNHLEVDTLPSSLKGKYTEKGVIQNSGNDTQGTSHQLIQAPSEIPLPTPAQLPPAFPQFPPIPTDNSASAAAGISGLPSLAFPGFIQPNLLAAVFAQQQQAPSFDNLFTALQQNANTGILPTPPVGQPPNIFPNLAFDSNVKKTASEQSSFQPNFNSQRGAFLPRFDSNFRGRGRGEFRPRFNRGGGGQNGEFRPRGGHGRGDFRGGQRFLRRGNFQNANFQPLAPFVPGKVPMSQSDTSRPEPMVIDTSDSNAMEIENPLSS